MSEEGSGVDAVPSPASVMPPLTNEEDELSKGAEVNMTKPVPVTMSQSTEVDAQEDQKTGK